MGGERRVRLGVVDVNCVEVPGLRFSGEASLMSPSWTEGDTGEAGAGDGVSCTVFGGVDRLMSSGAGVFT